MENEEEFRNGFTNTNSTAEVNGTEYDSAVNGLEHTPPRAEGGAGDMAAAAAPKKNRKIGR